METILKIKSGEKSQGEGGVKKSVPPKWKKKSVPRKLITKKKKKRLVPVTPKDGII